MVANRENKEWVNDPEPVPVVRRLEDQVHPWLWALATLGLLCGIAIPPLQLRQQIAIQDPLWLDELHSIWATDVPDGAWESIARRAAAGNQMPLYFWLEKQLREERVVFIGYRNASYRRLSWLAGILLIVVSGWTVFRWTRSPAGAGLAAGLLACSESQHFYGTEARPYELLALLGLLQASLLGTALWVRSGAVVQTFRIVLLLVLSVAVVLTHAVGALLLVAELIAAVAFCLLAPPGPAPPAVSVSDQPRWRRGLAGRLLVSALAPVAGLVVLAWHLPRLGHTVANRTVWGIVADPWSTAWDLALPTGLAAATGLIAAVLGGGWLALPGRVSGARLACFFVTVTVLVAGLVQAIYWSGFAPLALPRYQAAVWGLMPVAAGLFASGVKRQSVGWILPLAICLIAVRLPLLPRDWSDPNRTWRTLCGNPFGEPLWDRQLLMRFEDWSAVSKAIDLDIDRIRSQPADNAFTFPPGQPVSVFLLSNLVEDSLLRPASGSGAIPEDQPLGESGCTLGEYCQFPLRNPECAWYRNATNSPDVRPRSTLLRPRFSADDISLIESGVVWLVARCDEATARDVFAELQEKLAPSGRKLKLRELVTAPGNVVRVWRLESEPPPAGEPD